MTTLRTVSAAAAIVVSLVVLLVIVATIANTNLNDSDVVNRNDQQRLLSILFDPKTVHLRQPYDRSFPFNSFGDQLELVHKHNDYKECIRYTTNELLPRIIAKIRRPRS